MSKHLKILPFSVLLLFFWLIVCRIFGKKLKSQLHTQGLPLKSRLFNLSQGTREAGTFLRPLFDKSRLCNEVMEESKAVGSMETKARLRLIVTCFKSAQPKIKD